MGGQFGQRQRQSGSADHHLGPGINGRLDQRLVIGQGHHYVDADDAVRRNGAGLFELGLKGPQLGLEIVGAGVVVAIQGDTGRRHQADAAGLGHMAGQIAAGDADPHAALDQGIAYGMLADG